MNTKIFQYPRSFFWRLFCLSLLITFSFSSQAQFWKQEQASLLAEQEAFKVDVYIDESALKVNWIIADDYYLYRDNFDIEILNSDLSIKQIDYPTGVIEDDPEFGEVEVYFYNALLVGQLGFKSGAKPPQTINVLLKAQGCNKPVGVCYPPMQRELQVSVPSDLIASLSQSTINSSVEPTKEPNPETQSPLTNSFWSYILSAFGAGLLLSLTPCVLPMIPILAGLIAGQNNTSGSASGGKWASGGLAISYVAGTVVTYMIAGAVAGATGAQLQAYFQNVWVIGFVCLLLLALAASLFGMFRIELPSSVQTRLQSSSGQGSSSVWPAFLMGLISALVVGACVSPILILALGTAITQGDPVLGAGIMGAMALGMGCLLLAFGFGAGWILPKTGAWMEKIQVLFGFMVLGVAIYIFDGLTLLPSMYLWSALLLVSGFYVFDFGKALSQTLTSAVIKGFSAGLIIWASMAMVGATLGGNDILNPLEKLAGKQAEQSQLSFQRTTTLSQVSELLAQAKRESKPVLVDFYADWCLDCKRMKRTTFKDPGVKQATNNWILIEIDVTKTNEDSETVKKYFNVFGPPATLFFDSQGVEKEQARQYGYISSADFITLLKSI